MKKGIIALSILLATCGPAVANYQGITKARLNLREAPNKRSKVIKIMDKNEAVFVLTDELRNNFRKVIEIQSGAVGWVCFYYIQKIRDTKVEKDNVLHPTIRYGYDNPKAVIKNNILEPITIVIGSDIYTIVYDEEKEIIMPSGKAEFTVAVSGSTPITHEQYLSNGYHYYWGIDSLKK